jgi:hypothetical protein
VVLGMQLECENEEIFLEYYWRNHLENCPFKDGGLDGKVILKLIAKNLFCNI